MKVFVGYVFVCNKVHTEVGRLDDFTDDRLSLSSTLLHHCLIALIEGCAPIALASIKCPRPVW